MTNLTSVGVTNGVPTSGTGTVSTIDGLMAVLGTPGQGPVSGATTVIQPSDQAFVVQDGGTSFTSVWGVAGVPFSSANATSVVSVTDAPTAGQKLVIDDIIVSVDTAMSITLKEETSGTVMFGPWYCSANSGPMQITLRGKKKLPTINKKLQVITSASGNITVQVGYHSEA